MFNLKLPTKRKLKCSHVGCSGLSESAQVLRAQVVYAGLLPRLPGPAVASHSATVTVAGLPKGPIRPPAWAAAPGQGCLAAAIRGFCQSRWELPVT